MKLKKHTGNIFYVLYCLLYIFFLIAYAYRKNAVRDLQHNFLLVLLAGLLYDSIFISGHENGAMHITARSHAQRNTCPW